MSIFFVYFSLLICFFSKIHADYGVSSWGELKYKADFTHFDYVNPHAPKTGKITVGGLGSFDSFNPYIVQGTSAANLATPLYATLLEPAYDEVNVAYAYVANSVEVSQDGLQVTFYLNEAADFSDGTPITAEDIKFSFDALVNKGLPAFKTYYQGVKTVRIDGPHTIIFVLKDNKNKELPVLLGQIPVLSKAFYEKIAFDKSSLTPPPSSGPYAIEKFEAGQSVTYKRRQKWWGANIPSQRGRYNFESVELLYFRDTNALFEAFKSGKIHYRIENLSKLWHTSYDFDAAKDGRVVREYLEHKMSTGTQGFYFNTRRPIFKDINVRKALTLLYNFEWVNESIFYGAYKRSLSYFPNSEFQGTGPLDAASQKILKTVGIIDIDAHSIFTLPVYDDAHDHRVYHQQALDLFKKAGWALKNDILQNEKGEAFTFEFLISDKSTERMIAQYVQTLKRLGIRVFVRYIDVSSYQERLENLDFDMIMGILPQSNSPGGELYNYYGSKGADQRGTFNFAGIRDAKIDTLITRVVETKSYEDLKTCTKALDHMLLRGYYMIPNWYNNHYNLARWYFIQRPKISPAYMPFAFDTWWRDDTVKPEPVPEKKRADTVSPSFWEHIKNFFS